MNYYLENYFSKKAPLYFVACLVFTTHIAITESLTTRIFHTIIELSQNHIIELSFEITIVPCTFLLIHTLVMTNMCVITILTLVIYSGCRSLIKLVSNAIKQMSQSCSCLYFVLLINILLLINQMASESYGQLLQ